MMMNLLVTMWKVTKLVMTNMTVFKMWMMAKLVMKKRTMQLITGEDEYDCCNNVKDGKNGYDAICILH